MKLETLFVALLLSGISPHAFAENQIDTVRERAVQVLTRFGAIGGQPEGTCATCHSFNPNMIESWGQSADRINFTCFNYKPLSEIATKAPVFVEQVIKCMSDDRTQAVLKFSPKKLGLYAAAAHLDDFAALFQKAYGPNGNSKYQSFLSEVKMPVDGVGSLSKEDVAKVDQWSKDGRPFLYELMGNVEYPTTCTPFISSKLLDHINEMKLSGWEARNKEAGVMMFACSNNDALSCFNQKNARNEDIFPMASNTLVGRTWQQDFPNSQMKIVHKLDYNTNYWMRTSADGRFVGNGLSSKTSLNAVITDLQGLLTPAHSGRNILVDSNYDPSFFSDNSGFMFQGSGTGICRQHVLNDTRVTTIDWTHPACSRTGDHSVGLYQSVGSSLNGDDLIAVTGNFESNSGGSTDYDQPFNSQETARVKMIAYNGSRYQTVGNKSINMPFQGDFALSPSGKLLIARLTGADEHFEPVYLGYNIYSLATEKVDGDIAVETEKLATICHAGRKSNMSFNERFLAYYMPVRVGDWVELGFSSATDPEFINMVDNSGNVFIFDFMTGINRRVTRMAPGQFAQFPHFRSDGWLMFMVQGQDRYVVASDAALVLSGL